MRYRELIEKLEERGLYREADYIEGSVNKSDEVTEYDLYSEVPDSRVASAARRILREEG